MNLEIQYLIEEGQKIIFNKSVIRRNAPLIDDYLKIGKIITILGGRRTGKTHLMIQYIQDMIKKSTVALEDVVFIDFSYDNNKSIKLSEICAWFESRDKKPCFVLDEIQEVPEFDRQLVGIYNKGYTCLMSGSNSKMLSQELSTLLRGRTMEVYNSVLDRDEFQEFKKSSHINQTQSQLREEYLIWGGYPEVVLTDSEVGKRSLLQSYLDVLIYKDLIDRYRIRNQEVLIALITYCIKSHTKLINPSKIHNMFKSQGYAIARNTIYEYLQYLKNTFFISSLSNNYKNSYFDKIYLLDNGYMNLVSNEHNYGQKLEHIVYQKLMKTHRHELGFVDGEYEIDFSDNKTNRQVCYNLNYDNLKRELKFAKSDKQNILITRYNETKPVQGVIYQTIFEFLLS